MTLKLERLGIKRIREFNCAILSKWLWRFGLEDGSHWRSVIAGKYGIANKWETKKVTDAHGVSLWNVIS